MTRRHGLDDICALCDEYSVKLADPEQAALGRGQCQVAERGRTLRHVEWNNQTCVSHRLDRPNLAARRQYVAMRRRTQPEANEAVSCDG